MSGPLKPSHRPQRPFFSSGPCAKRPGWTPSVLSGAPLGRSHRSAPGKMRLSAVIDETRAILGIPADYRIAITPGSDTGAVEMALWSLLGPRPVDILAWETFGKDWAIDVIEQLRLPDARLLDAPYGALPDLTRADWNHDVVFTWNGTTSGVCIPNGNWIDPARRGLSLCDATSAVFAMDLPWDRLDVTTWSWQKVLGGEAAHGMLVLSPRAVERLTTHNPTWPVPKLFRLTKNGQINEGVFRGETINTPSMLCVEDALDSLCWVREKGGLPEALNRTRSTLKFVETWVARTPWIDFLCTEPTYRSSTSICLILNETCPLAGETRAQAPKRMATLLDREGIAFDINAHRAAPPGLRLWGGATVDPEDMEALLPWIEWAYAATISKT